MVNSSFHSFLHSPFALLIEKLKKVTSSLAYFPEKCTVVALYKRLVVGAAFLSSPVETYLTYLVVRSGWECSGVARLFLFYPETNPFIDTSGSTILYLLLNFHPTKDITLHVSANNSAMVNFLKAFIFASNNPFSKAAV